MGGVLGGARPERWRPRRLARLRLAAACTRMQLTSRESVTGRRRGTPAGQPARTPAFRPPPSSHRHVMPIMGRTFPRASNRTMLKPVELEIELFCRGMRIGATCHTEEDGR